MKGTTQICCHKIWRYRKNNGIQFVGIPEYPSLGHNVGREIQNVLEGKITVSEALENSQKLVSDQ
ncbi:MAG: hypothetical protein ABIJ59_12835, partial [Pseudomonadota bacterium]